MPKSDAFGLSTKWQVGEMTLHQVNELEGRNNGSNDDQRKKGEKWVS